MQNVIKVRLFILKIPRHGHESRAITLLFLNEIIPLAIPYHSSPIPISMHEKNRSKGTKVRARKQSADGQTDGRTDTQSSEGITDTPPLFVWRGMIIKYIN